MNQELYTHLAKLLADTYAVYLKTQNYHWHVKGPLFKTLHTLFEEQYEMLAEAVDEIAERIVTLGYTAPASYTEFAKLTSIADGNSDRSSEEMLKDLHRDHTSVIEDLYKVVKAASAIGDEGTASMLSDRIVEHEEIRWMLGASAS